MPRGKKVSTRPSAGGIKRNDYHRRNRKANISTFCTSSGRNVTDTIIEVPVLERDELLRRAGGASPAKCVDYLRKQQAQGRDLRVLQAISYAYPWLSSECDRRYNAERLRIRRIFRQMTGSLTRIQVEELNSPSAIEIDEGYVGEDDGTFRDAPLSSLHDSSRLIYFPPFLNPDAVRLRRFTDVHGEMNDKWWEWEKELRLTPWTFYREQKQKETMGSGTKTLPRLCKKPSL